MKITKAEAKDYLLQMYQIRAFEEQAEKKLHGGQDPRYDAPVYRTGSFGCGLDQHAGTY